MTIIGLSGWAQAGKDTVGGQLVNDYGFHRYAFADALKEVAFCVNPWIAASLDEQVKYRIHRFSRLADLITQIGPDEAKQLAEVRRFYQDLGVEMREHVSDGVWVNAVMGRIDTDPWDIPVRATKGNDDQDEASAWRQRDYIITDVRFPDELAAIRSRNGEIWRIERPGTLPPNDHISERSLDDVQFDRVICNDGTLDDLADMVAKIMTEVAR